MNILISAGHGAGAQHNRGALLFNEGDNNYHYSLFMKSELEEYENVTVDLIRKKITDNPHYDDRSTMGIGYDLFLDIHSNAAKESYVRGSEIFDNVKNPNEKLAEKIVEATANAFNHPNRGVKYKEKDNGDNWYGVLRGNEAKSSMIIENGFHTNYEDSTYFLNSKKELATIQAKVIADHYKLKKKNIISDWAIEAQEWVIERGISDGTRPKEMITREETWTINKRMYEQLIEIITKSIVKS